MTTQAHCTARALRVGGLTPLSTTDYPGCLSAVVFCRGCPWRCAYCHNPHLRASRGSEAFAWSDVVAFLRRRAGLLDAVVFSGGEPLAQAALARAMRAVRRLGFRVGLHTGGGYPARLAEVLPLVDWVGFDIKAPFADYAKVTMVEGSGERARESARSVLESGVACEFRTTVHPHQLDAAAIERLTDELAALGARHYALQAFRPTGCTDAALIDAPPASPLIDAWRARIAPKFESFAVRHA